MSIDRCTRRSAFTGADNDRVGIAFVLFAAPSFVLLFFSFSFVPLIVPEDLERTTEHFAKAAELFWSLKMDEKAGACEVEIAKLRTANK